MYLFVFTLVNASVSFAGPSRTTYQAKIIKPDGYPLESASVNFKFTILDPAGSCILYSETYSSVNMGNTGGLISFSLGSGVKTYPASATTFEQVFSNITSSLSCDVGGPVSYSPSADDVRKIVMQFHDGSGWQTLPAMNINAVPYAMYANTAQTLNGKLDTDFVQVSTLSNCSASEALNYNGVGFSCVALPSVSAGAVVAALGYTPANGASVTTLTSSVASANVTIATVSSTVYSVSSTVTSLQNSVAASFAAITSSQWLSSGTTISYSTGNVGIGTSNPASRLHIMNGSSGGSSGSGSFTLESSGNTYLQILSLASGTSQIRFGDAVSSGRGNISYSHLIDQLNFYTSATQRMMIGGTGNVGIGTNTPVTKLEVSGGVRISMEAATCAASYAGTLRYNSGVVEYCNGTSWSAFGVAGAGITNMNGSTSGAQTFATGTVGTSFNVVTANGVHTFNIPLASAGSVTAGLLSNADYTTFMGKITSSAASIAQVLGYTPASATSLGNYLVRSNNLSDLTNSATARTNLGVGYIGTLSALSSSNVTTALGFTPAPVSASTQWTSSGTSIYYSSGNVGIGTSNPAVALDVNGSIRGDRSGALRIDSGSGTLDLGAQNTAFAHFMTDRPAFYFNQKLTLATGALTSTSGGVDLALQTGGFTRMTLLDSNGNVGIGITNPTSKLDVSGAITATAGAGTINLKAGPVSDHTYIQFFARSASPTTRSGYIGYPSTGSNQLNIFNEISAGSISFGTSGTQRMVVLPTGEVGVGVSPSAKFHVAGGSSSLAPLKITSGPLLSSAQAGAVEYDGSYYYITDGTNTRRAIATVANPGTFDNASTLSAPGNMTLDANSSVIVSNTTASTNSSTGALVVNGGLGVAGNINASGTIITTSNISGSEIYATSATITPYIYGSTLANGSLRLESTTNATKGNILMATGGGKVGIGYASPLAKIHVGGSISGAYRSWMDNGMIVGKSGDSDGGYFGLKDEGANRQDTVIAWGDDPQDTLRFIFNASGGASDGTELMRIAATGNVGIGTSAPVAKLEVRDAAPTFRLQETTTGGDKRIELGVTASGAAWIGANQSAQDLAFQTVGSEKMRLTSTGNLGIGTSAPSQKLVVGDDIGSVTANNAVVVGAAGTSNSQIFLGNNTTNFGNIMWNGSSKYLTLRTSSGTLNASQFVLSGDGRVGINTATPSYKFDVVGLDGDGLFYRTSTRAVGIGQYNGESSVAWGALDPLTFTNGGAEKMRITSAGAVGIGTAAPSSNLEIVGGHSTLGILRITTTSDVASGGSSFMRFNDVNGPAGYVGFGGTNSRFDINSYKAGSMVLGTNNIERMRITASGAVGIGDSNPIGQLVVASGPTFTAGYTRNLVLFAQHPAMQFKGISDTNHSGGIGYDAQSNSEAMRFWVKATTDDLQATATEAMTLTASGNVGIGTTGPSEKLEVAGNIKAVSYLYTSDERLKKDIITLPDALTKALQLRGVNFVWRNTNEKTVGFIAQEVEKVYPELVKTDKVTGFKAVQYGNIVAILVEALRQEHDERVRSIANVSEQAENRINQLEKENQDLKTRLEKIEKFLSEKVK